MTPDLDELKRLAERVKKWETNPYVSDEGASCEFRKAANPETVLSLLKMIEQFQGQLAKHSLEEVTNPVCDPDTVPDLADEDVPMKWVSVQGEDAELPPYGSCVKVYGYDSSDEKKISYQDLATYSFMCGFHVGLKGSDMIVTHWMPLDAPPTDRGEGRA